MPRIVLKPQSPEFADSEGRGEGRRLCDMPGCAACASFRAPKHRGLDEYYYFCLEHVIEYNKAWDYFSGMSEREVQDHVLRSHYGDRPTWRYDTDAGLEDMLRRKAQETRGFDGAHEKSARRKGERKTGGGSITHGTPECEARAIMGLEPPITLDEIRATYKALVKKHHPDLNGGCKRAEEKLKQINMAYTILKLAHEAFEKLPQRA